MTRIYLGDLIGRHAAAKAPDAVAIRYPNGVLTWADLDAESTRWARFLRTEGVQQDDLVMVGLPNTTTFHSVSLGLWKLGATPTIVSPKLPPQEFQALARLVRPALIVGGQAAPSGRPWAPADSDLSRWDPTPFPASLARYWKAMSTGGSTGLPKIIVDHQASDWDPQVNTGVAVGITSDDVILNPGPLYHNTPFCVTHFGLFNGAAIVGMGRFEPEEALRLIAEHKVTWVSFVPTMMHRIWSLPREVRERYDVSSLKRVWHMAAPCPAWLKEAWIDWLGPEKIFEAYGGTEGFGTTVIRGDEWLKKRGSVGRLSGDAKVKAVREDGTDCAAGEVGELYFLRADINTIPSHYVGAEPKALEGGWRSIGDLGHVDEDGYVFLADRRTDLILRGGANIYPAEVEAALDAHPEVGSSLVVGLPCEDLGQRVHAIVQPKSGEALDVQTLHHFLEARLARFKLPESYEFSGEPLRDDAGKARRSAVRDRRAEWLKTGREFQIRVRSEHSAAQKPESAHGS
jgi:bile acid-coenzyme A ligase